MLVQFLADDSGGTIDVLLEVEAPDPIAAYKMEAGDDAPRFAELVVNSESASRKQSERVKATRSLLDSLKIPYRFSPSARVFAIAVTAGQLRQLLAAQSVRSIVPNRRVRM